MKIKFLISSLIIAIGYILTILNTFFMYPMVLIFIYLDRYYKGRYIRSINLGFSKSFEMKKLRIDFMISAILATTLYIVYSLVSFNIGFTLGSSYIIQPFHSLSYQLNAVIIGVILGFFVYFHMSLIFDNIFKFTKISNPKNNFKSVLKLSVVVLMIFFPICLFQIVTPISTNLIEYQALSIFVSCSMVTLPIICLFVSYLKNKNLYPQM